MPLSLLLIDLDDFKKINDTFGHPAGDKVLATFGRILREGCRGSDLVARYGGEEFAVMLPSTPSSAAFEIAQRLRSRLSATVFVFDGKNLRLTVSIGIAQTASVRNDAIVQLVSRADQALYRAKESGKDMACVYASRSPEINKRESSLRESGVAWLRSA
jgi:diguanylate cyclase (GGDEF)-like protein